MNCEICGDTAVRLREFYFDAEERIELKRCQSCSCEYLFPQPSNQLLAKEYKNYYERRSSGMQRPKLAYFKTLLRSTGFDFSGKSILEVGAGEGDCALALTSLWPTADYTAVEANSECESFYAEIDCTLRPQSIEDWLATEEESRYDYILLFDLMEHLREPKRTLQKIVDKKLKKGGHIIATFPSVNSFTRLFLGPLWPQYKLEHLFYFSKAAILHMEPELNLKNSTVKPLSKRLPLGFLITVGKNFGPKPVRGMVRALATCLPRPLQAIALKLPLGEALWVAQK